MVLRSQLSVRWLCRRRTLYPVVVAATLLFGVLLLYWKQQTITRPHWLEVKTCSPKTNIAFLKTHKCASSTIQSMLYRYGDKHNLNFALPEKGVIFGSGNQTFTADMVLSSPLNKLKPNIFATHTKWDHAEMKKLMPEDTFFFTIVREPMAVFESQFSFFDIEKKTGLTMEDYTQLKVSVDSESRKINAGFNHMAWDFGMSEQQINNLTAVSKMVRRADKQFDLVLIAERMEESLVLLANYLCWELSDVLVLKLNSRSDEFRTTISEKTRQVLQQKLAPDYLLYRHFLEKFDQQVEAFGRGRMAAMVARLRELMSQLVSSCNFVKKTRSQMSNKYKLLLPKFDQPMETFGRSRMAAKVSRQREMMSLLANTCNFVTKTRKQITVKYRFPSPKVDMFETVVRGGGCKPYIMHGIPLLTYMKAKQYKKVQEKFGPLKG